MRTSVLNRSSMRHALKGNFGSALETRSGRASSDPRPRLVDAKCARGQVRGGASGGETGLVPPTAHLTESDPALGLDVVRGAARQASGAVLSNSFGFGGQNVSLIFSA